MSNVRRRTGEGYSAAVGAADYTRRLRQLPSPGAQQAIGTTDYVQVEFGSWDNGCDVHVFGHTAGRLIEEHRRFVFVSANGRLNVGRRAGPADAQKTLRYAIQRAIATGALKREDFGSPSEAD